jgi:hypothetical protein
MGDGSSVALATCSRSGDLLSGVANVGLVEADLLFFACRVI